MLDLAEKRIIEISGTAKEKKTLELSQKPLLTFGILAGSVALFLGLGRLPAMFWLLGTAAVSVRKVFGFYENLFISHLCAHFVGMM